MVGSTRDEAKLFAVAVPGVRLAPAGLVDKFYASMFKDDAVREIVKLYPYASYRRPADAAMDALGDMVLGCKCFFAAEAVSAINHVYYYRFDFDNHIAPHIIGAAHGFEIPFVFGNLDRVPANYLITICNKEQATALSNLMMSYWTNFAKTGNPNQQGLPEWPKYNKDGRQRMYFDKAPAARPTDNVRKCEFWDKNALPMTE
jgi:para-nitrobenzyl esterase